MTVYGNPPVNFTGMSGRMKQLPDADKLIREWFPLNIKDAGEHDLYSFLYPVDQNDRSWLFMGFCPQPKTQREWFHHYWHHGRIMRYPRRDVAAFCVRMAWFKLKKKVKR